MFRKVRRVGKQLSVDVYNFFFNRSYGQVIMLHRIGPKEPERLQCLGELRVSVEQLQRFVDHNRNRYDFVSLDDVFDRVYDSSKRRRPFICFTIDDGFRDNLTEGLPFFEKNEIPFAVFLTVDYINRHPAFNYPFVLERMIMSNEEMFVEGNHYICKTDEQKNSTFAKLKNLVLSQAYDSFEHRFETMFSQYVTDDCREDLTMTWDEVCEMAASPLCTIGSHTMTHCRLSSVPKKKLVYELGESKRQIEEKLGQPCDYISYPFGWTTDVDKDVFDTARRVGYKMGFVSHGGGIRKNDIDLFRVKRLMLIENE